MTALSVGRVESAITATPGPDTAPVVSPSNLAVAHNQSLAASSLFNVSDADGDSMTKYAFYDVTRNGHLVVNGVVQGTGVEIDITAAQLAQTSYVAGSGTDQSTYEPMTAICGVPGNRSRSQRPSTRHRS